MRVVKEYVRLQMTMLLDLLSVLGNVMFTGNSFPCVCYIFTNHLVVTTRFKGMYQSVISQDYR